MATTITSKGRTQLDQPLGSGTIQTCGLDATSGECGGFPLHSWTELIALCLLELDVHPQVVPTSIAVVFIVAVAEPLTRNTQDGQHRCIAEEWLPETCIRYELCWTACRQCRKVGTSQSFANELGKKLGTGLQAPTLGLGLASSLYILPLNISSGKLDFFWTGARGR